MYQSRLLKIIERLSPRQKEQFKNFVCSPYFNQHEKTTQLLSLIYEALEDTEQSLDKKKIFQQLFPKQTFDEQKLHNIMSYLQRLYHQFLAFQALESKPFVEQLYTLEEAFKTNQWDIYTNRYKLLEKNLQQHPVKNADYYLNSYFSLSQQRQYRIDHVDRSDQEVAQSMLQHLDYFFIHEKLRQACTLTIHEMLVNTNYNFFLLDAVYQYVAEHWEIFKLHHGIAAYFTVLKMLRDRENPIHYHQLKSLLQENPDKFSSESLNDLYSFTTNFCIMRINQNDVSYKRELFEIYQQSLKNEVLLQHGKLDGWVYKNIATLGCNLKEYNWTFHFIENYKEKIPSSQKNNAYNYSLAYYHLSRQDYNSSMRLLQEVEFTEVHYHLSGNLLLMRSYYELNDTESLLSLLESMRLYVLRSKKLIGTEKKGYTNLIRFTKSLVLLRSDKNFLRPDTFQNKYQSLVDKITSTKNIIAKSWLEGKCQELIGAQIDEIREQYG